MSTFRVVVDDLSPLVQYSRGYIGWEARSQNATGGTDGTYHYTDWSNSTVNLDFSGSAVTVYGKSNRGYVAAIDGTLNQISSPPNDTNVLFAAQNLTLGFHSVSISNFEDGSGDLDFELDSYVIDSVVAATGSSYNSTTLSGNSSNIRTSGSTAVSDNALWIHGKGSGFAFKFTGASIAIYAPKWTSSTPSGSQYAVYVNKTFPPADKDVPFYSHPSDYPGGNGRGQLRFLANGLPEGQHQIAIVNVGDSGGSFGFEYADIAIPTAYISHPNICWSNCSATDSKGPGYTDQRAASITSTQGNSASRTGMSIGCMVLAICLAFVSMV